MWKEISKTYAMSSPHKKSGAGGKAAHGGGETESHVNPEEVGSTRRSLFDVVKDRLRKLNRHKTRELDGRILYAGRYTDKCNNKQAVKIFHQNLMSKIPSLRTASGLLLLFPQTFVHFLEADTEGIMELLGNIIDPKQNIIITDLRILSYSDDVIRALPHKDLPWSAKELSMPAAEAPGEDEDVLSLCTNMVLHFCELANRLRKLRTPNQVQNFLDTLRSSAPDLVPRQETVLFLCNSPAAERELLSIEEFVYVFIQGGGPMLDPTVGEDELAWPAPQPLSY